MLSDWKITTAHGTQRDQDEMQKRNKIPGGTFDGENAVSRTFVTFSARSEKEKNNEVQLHEIKSAQEREKRYERKNK